MVDDGLVHMLLRCNGRQALHLQGGIRCSRPREQAVHGYQPAFCKDTEHHPLKLRLQLHAEALLVACRAEWAGQRHG